MATAREYGLTAAGISVAIIAAVQIAQIMKPYDPVAERYAFINRECAKPRPDGGHREVVYIGNQSWYKFDNDAFNKLGYAICPPN